MSNIAITINGISKCYRIGLKEEKQETLWGSLLTLVTKPWSNFRRLMKLTSFQQGDGESEDTIWALDDVSFEIAKGEIIGLIGLNGAGKSTLLKILAKITMPTSGQAVVHGKIASLLEVGTGFHPELTGRENIYLNGTILGMTKVEIDEKFDDIVAFSEIEKFVDTPVKRYSSGMRVRLGFAVAAHLEPDILLVDEVLAVGDFAFQQKCLGKMNDIAAEGRTVIFVSHNMEMIQRLCPRTVLLKGGKKVMDGETERIIEQYYHNPVYGKKDCHNLYDTKRYTDNYGKLIRYTECRLYDAKNRETDCLLLGEPIKIQVKAIAIQNLQNVDFEVIITSAHKTEITAYKTSEKDLLFNLSANESIQFSFEFKDLVLNAGEYIINISILRDNKGIDVVYSAKRFSVSAVNYSIDNHYIATFGLVRCRPSIESVITEKG